MSVAQRILVHHCHIFRTQPCAQLRQQRFLEIYAPRIGDVVGDAEHGLIGKQRIAERAVAILESDTRTGVLVEYGRTDQIFQDPADSRTRAYVTGRMG